MPSRACSRCGELRAEAGMYLCADCTPPPAPPPRRRCGRCQQSYTPPPWQRWRLCEGCRRQADAARQQQHRTGTPRRQPRHCGICGLDITHTHGACRYCRSCAAAAHSAVRAREQQQRRLTGRDEAPRDLALEARIDAHLRAIRASRRYRLDDETIWARRVDVVAERAPVTWQE